MSNEQFRAVEIYCAGIKAGYRNNIPVYNALVNIGATCILGRSEGGSRWSDEVSSLLEFYSDKYSAFKPIADEIERIIALK